MKPLPKKITITTSIACELRRYRFRKLLPTRPPSYRWGLIPDSLGVILPSQIEESMNLPVHSLMRAILLTSLRDAFGNGRAVTDSATLQNVRRQALFWLYSQEKNYLFSFRNICEELGLNAERFLSKVEKSKGLFVREKLQIEEREKAAKKIRYEERKRKLRRR